MQQAEGGLGDLAKTLYVILILHQKPSILIHNYSYKRIDLGYLVTEKLA